jgi:hypothetical protein
MRAESSGLIVIQPNYSLSKCFLYAFILESATRIATKPSRLIATPNPT